MTIVDRLKENIFKEDRKLLERLAYEWHDINAKLLAYVGQRNFEGAFLNILTEEIHRKLPDLKIFTHVKINTIQAPNGEKVVGVLGVQLEDIRQRVCGSYANSTCRNLQKCFGGKYPSGTEIDALIIRDKDFCFLEYETTRLGLCFDFMKMYWLQRLLNRQFESLFVTKLTTRLQPEGVTTFESFNNHINNIKATLDKLIQHWSVLEIVNLSGSEKRRRFHWRP